MSKFHEGLARFSHVNELLTRKSNPKSMESKQLISQLCAGRGLDTVILGSCLLEALEVDYSTGWSLSAVNNCAHYELTDRKEQVLLQWVEPVKSLRDISKTELLNAIEHADYSKGLPTPLFNILDRDDGVGKLCGYSATTTKSKNRNPTVITFYYTNKLFNEFLKVTFKAIEEPKPVGYNGRVDTDETDSGT